MVAGPAEHLVDPGVDELVAEHGRFPPVCGRRFPQSPTSTTALMTPVSGRVYDGKTSISSSNAARWVIQGRVSIWPSSMSR